MCSKVDHPLLMPPLPRKEKNKFPQKIETSTIWKKINICDVKKNVTTIWAPAKKLSGGARPKIPPKTYGKRDPPHGENGLYVERNDSAHIEKNTLIGETVSPT